MSGGIAVIGAGAVLASGTGVSAFWAAAREARACVGPLRSALLRSERVTAFAQVPEADDGRARTAIARNLQRYCTPALFWGAAALREALAESELAPGDDGLRYGLYACQGGYTHPSMASYGAVLQACRRDGVADLRELTRQVMQERAVDPFVVIKSLNSVLLGVLSLDMKLYCEGNAFMQGVAGNQAALQEACAALHAGRIDVALLVGAGSDCDPLALADLVREGTISAEGAAQVLPYDRHSRGGIAGEGAVALVLRRHQDIAGPCVQVQPLGSHAELARLNLPDRPLALAVSSGSGRPALDRALLQRLLDCGAEHVTSALPVTGLLAAAPLFADVLLARQALLEGEVPPIAGLHAAVLDTPALVRDQVRVAALDAALVVGRDANGFSSACLLQRSDAGLP